MPQLSVNISEVDYQKLNHRARSMGYTVEKFLEYILHKEASKSNNNNIMEIDI